MSWGNVIGGAVAIGGSLLNKKSAKSAAAATRPTPYQTTGPAGTTTVAGNTLTMNAAQNPFSPLFQMLGGSSFANAATAPGAFLYGADPELADAYRGMFGQGLTDTIAGQYDLLNQMAAPGENRQRLGLQDMLQARGTGGTSGGAEMFRGLEEALAMADLQRQNSAVGLGQNVAGNRFSSALQGVQSGMGGQLQQFNIGQGAFGGLQSIMENIFRQAGLGVAAGGGQSPGAAVYASQAAGAVPQAVNQFLQNSGAYDALGRGLGNIFGGGGYTPPVAGQPGYLDFSPSSYQWQG
jgi:hypothetical protein